MTQQISAIIFDMDGLMIDTQSIGLRTWRMVCAERGYDFDDTYYHAVIGKTIPDIKQTYQQLLGPDFPFEELYAVRKQYFDALVQAEGIPVKPGLIQLLDWLDEVELARAVATSTDRARALARLDTAGILDRFSIIVCGDEVERGKPAPDIFLKAAAALKIPPAQCLVLEDSAAGIRAAHAAGMMSIMVPDLVKPDEEVRTMAYRVVPSLVEAQPLLASLTGEQRA